MSRDLLTINRIPPVSSSFCTRRFVRLGSGRRRFAYRRAPPPRPSVTEGVFGRVGGRWASRARSEGTWSARGDARGSRSESQRMAAAAGAGGVRARRAQEVALTLANASWSAAQIDVLRRAECLRAVGAAAQAAYLVASHCSPPAVVTPSRVAAAVRLDVRRWYAALTGGEWDGRAETFQSAKARARRLVRDGRDGSDGRQVSSLRVYRTSHLLVEPLDAHPQLDVLRDYTRLVGWPAVCNVGHLHWNDEGGGGDECAYCQALLLPGEANRVHSLTSRRLSLPSFHSAPDKRRRYASTCTRTS